MTKIIMLDFWGTIVENGVWSPTKQIRNLLQIRVPFSDYVVRMQTIMMTKQFESLTEMFETVCAEFDIPANSDLTEELVGMWNKNWMLAKPYDETVAALQTLNEKYKVVLVCNTDSVSVPNVLEKYNLTQYFTEVFLSCTEGMIKTNPEFLQHIMKKMSATPEECVFVGDSMQSDIIPAETAQVPAILLDRKGRREYQRKIKNLQELEGVLE